MIAGGPGAGKSGAAVLLILAALRHRRSVPDTVRPQVPVPVMFTLHGWNPTAQRARDWLAERLWQDYPLFGGRRGAAQARGMLDAGRIAVILDGLDEIAGDLRPGVLRALSQQATFRLVLLTRSAEMADAAAQAQLQGAAAIELQDIDPDTAADYLTRTQLDPPPQGWQELTSQLRQDPGSPLARALTNPLMLTLVRDTYRGGDDVGELLRLRDPAGHPASRQDIAGYLLDRVLPAAYSQQPGDPQPRYDLRAAERALRCIATRMNTDGTRDLQWWHVPAWTHAAPRIIVTCLGAGLAVGLGAGLVGGLMLGLGPAAGLNAGLWSGIIAMWVAGLGAGRGSKTPSRIAPIRWRQLFRLRRGLLVMILLSGLVIGLALGFAAGLRGGPAAGLEVGLFTLAAWLVAGLVTVLVTGIAGDTSLLSPLSSWRSDQALGLVIGLAVTLTFGFLGWLGYVWLWLEPSYVRPAVFGGWFWGWLGFCLAFGLVHGLVLPQSWSSSLAFAQLAASDRTPVRLMRFLEDARSRSVLRTVGPAYQFRHARLQDRLAAQEPVARQGPPGSAPAAGDAAARTTEAPPADAI